MRLGSLLVGSVLASSAMLIPASAAAEAPHAVVSADAAGAARPFDLVVGPETSDGIQLARQVLPPAAPGPAGLAQSRVVYLNRTGITLTPGDNDARTNRSTLVTASTTFAPWGVSASTWAATVSCMRDIFSPFDISIVETDPGNVPHIEAVFGGSPAQVGMASTVAGLSPFTTDCAVIENSIVFTFTSVIGADARLACEIQAQEVAHSFGLDHVLLAADLMTYLPYSDKRWFQNQNASCGEDKARPCGLNGSSCRPAQNSVATLIERVGLKSQAGDTVAPAVAITSPADGATVPFTFDVDFTASDNTKVTMVSLYVDDVPSGSVVVAPFTLHATKLSQGKHKIRVVATDGKNENSRLILVNVLKGASAPDGEGDVTGGCSAGGGPSGAGASWWLGVAGVAGMLVRRRRRSRAAARG